ncbi:MAG: 4a-hydroxytetrahydrobiopterin dehydratase [Synechococcaceae cyanobacterium RM1_1_27]|nr:4a-hydroxytetrahydrobiopterin dehydratase [Synechococcaceae cyanobacterium SM2_3_2]NJO86274.1 4a-hydroxytetrahydrobiopterin dehydratase [Synechococcaceae cyanobacterium RM1_1_27]
MPTPTKLSDADLQIHLDQVAGWTIVDNTLTKKFQFDSFISAFGWMTSAALVAETMGHHPEWTNVYNRVTVNLVTHDAGGITELDFTLAKRMDTLAGS